jgi:hypothetical protein
MHDEIASHDAKQRGDEGKSRQFAGGTLICRLFCGHDAWIAR